MAAEDRPRAESARDEQFEALVEAMGHPLRGKLLFVIADKPGVTIRQIAARLDEPERRIRYHLDALLTAKLVAVEGETRTRNTVERRYRGTRRPIIEPERAGALSAAQQRRISLEILKIVLADARGAVAAGTFGTYEGHAEIRFWAEVDRQGWEDLAAVHLKACDETKQVLERCKERLRDGTPSTFPMTSALLLFEAPGWEE